jgi:hypothetical protein
MSKINNYLSDKMICTSGIPQGSSGILFNLYINDIFSLPFSANLLCYADDLVMIHTFDNTLNVHLTLQDLFILMGYKLKLRSFVAPQKKYKGQKNKNTENRMKKSYKK